MTLSAAQALTPEEARAKLAELAGWTHIGLKWGYAKSPEGKTRLLPDYLHPVNGYGLLRPLELRAIEKDPDAYGRILEGSLADRFNDAAYYEWNIYCHIATADIRTRANAVLVVLA